MKKIIRNAKKKFSRMERGQVLVVVAVAAIGIIAIIGLVMDVGLIFIGNARLRRAVDSAALSAAMLYRKESTQTDLENSANEFLLLNGFSNPNSTISTCDFHTTPDMGCTAGQARKLVRVHATADIKLAFLPILGINSVPISATAISETASLDVVLVIDRSESMTYDAGTARDPATGEYLDPMRDPFYCNGYAPGAPSSYTDSYHYVHKSSCKPFRDVIEAAIQFTKIMWFDYDYMAIVTFDKNAGAIRNGERKPNLMLSEDCTSHPCTADQVVIPTLEGLTVFQGDERPGIDPVGQPGAAAVFDASGNTTAAPARCYGEWVAGDICRASPVWSPTSNYLYLVGPGQDPDITTPAHVEPPDPSPYTTTNIGAGLEMAGNELAADTRQNVLWVVILLTDGQPNAGYNDDTPPKYFCPESTWPRLPWCNDTNAAGDWVKAHRPLPTNLDPSMYPVPAPIPGTAPFYDSMAYAYDEADFVGLPFDPITNTGGQNALLYTIGLGNAVNDYAVTPFTDTVFDKTLNTTISGGLGAVFLKYAADVGHGLYYPSLTSDQLNTIFREIGSSIATRLAK